MCLAGDTLCDFFHRSRRTRINSFTKGNFKVVQVRVVDYFIDGLSQGILQTSLGKEILSDSRASRIYSKNAEASQ